MTSTIFLAVGEEPPFFFLGASSLSSLSSLSESDSLSDSEDSESDYEN